MPPVPTFMAVLHVLVTPASEEMELAARVRKIFPFVTCFIFQMLHHSKFHLTYNLLLQHFILSIQTSTNVQMEQITVTTMLIAVTHKETIFAPASSASPVLESPVQVKKSRIFII